ncbi:MAG: hypothetical protein JST47_11190 [Bacteroidetes bacterium]|nr:hypothetical protein [Bacteroidota bacterium]MBS1972949.1 hypothetical protein [Bacteroidota bacterium]
MKWMMVLPALLAITSWACNKNTVNSPKLTNVEATWNYIGYSGGLAGFRFTAVPSQGPYLQFNDSGLIVSYGVQGKQKCMQFQFQKDSAVYGNYQLTGLLTTSDTSFMLPEPGMKTYYLALRNDTLTLYPQLCADCFVSHYALSAKHFTCSENQ